MAATAYEVASNSFALVFEHLFTDKNVDCRFRFVDSSNQMEYAAHQQVLAANSSVFRAMFGLDWNDAAAPILIEDATYNTFSAFMDYFYNEKAVLTAENAVGILHLADKYDIQPLVGHCESFLVQQLSTSNVLAYYSVASRYGRNKMLTNCCDLMKQQYKAVLESTDFCSCDKATLAAFLRLLPEPCDEEMVFDACIKWSETECEENGNRSPSMEARRSVLGECFALIPFKSMDYEPFVERYKQYKEMFTRDESDAIFLHLLDSSRNRYLIKPLFKRNLVVRGNQVASKLADRDELGCIWFSIWKPLILTALTASRTFQNDVEIDFRTYIDVSSNGKQLFGGNVDFTSMNRRMVFPKKIFIDAGAELLISILRNGRANVEGFMYKRGRINNTEFAPIQIEGNRNITTGGICCSIESIEFDNLED